MFDRRQIGLAWLVLKGSTKKFFADNGLFLASGLAFDLLLYCMPFVLLITSAVGYTLVGSDRSLIWVELTLHRLLPRSHQAFFDTLSIIIANRGLLGLVGFPLFFILSASLLGSVRLVLNIVFKATPRPFLRGKGQDLGMVVVVAGLFMITVAISSVMALLRTAGEGLPYLGVLVRPGWLIASEMLVFLFTTALFYVLYRFSPAQTLSPRAVAVASVTGAGLFELSKWAFSLYISMIQPNAVLYGALGGVIFFFFWVYYACTVFVFSAEVGYAFDQVYKTP